MKHGSFGKVFQETGIVAFINLGVAFLAFGKDILFAAYFGTTRVADIFWLAFFIPDTIGYNLLFPAVTLSAVPFLTNFSQREESQEFSRFVSGYALITNGLVLLIILTIFLSQNFLVRTLALNVAPLMQGHFQVLLRIMLPVVFWGAWLGMASAILQSCGFFRSVSSAPLFMNGLLFIGLLFINHFGLSVFKGVYWVAGFYSVGTAGSVLFLWWIIFRLKVKRKLTFHFIRFGVYFPLIKNGLGLFWPYLLILCGYQGILIFERYLTSRLPIGYVAALNYAYRLSQFPVWVLGAALGMVIFPALAKSSDQGSRFYLLTTQAVFWSLFVGIPLSSGFFLLREPLVATLFQRGLFTADSLRKTTDILAGYSLAIPGQLLVLLSWRFFLARGKMIWPVLSTIGAMIVNICFDFYMLPELKGAALGYGAALGCSINSVLLLMGIYRYYQCKKAGCFGWNSFRAIINVVIGSGIWFSIALLLWPDIKSFRNPIFPWSFLTVVFSGLGLIYWSFGKNAWNHWMMEGKEI